MIKSKIRKIFGNEKVLEEYCLKIYEIDRYFYEYYEKKKKVDGNDHSYILLTVDVYFSEYILAVKVDEKGHTDRDLIFEKNARRIRKKT